MKFHNVDKIMDNIGVHNKYLLTSVIAQRARQISEMKGRRPGAENGGDPAEKAISLALEDMEEGNVHVQLRAATVADAVAGNRAQPAGSDDANGEKTKDAPVA